MEINDEHEFPRLLIVGTVPYNRQSTSRAFDAYFHEWPHERIAQVFSNAAEPLKGHCGRLFQMTDRMMLYRWFDSKVETGKVYHREDLQDETCATAASNPMRVGHDSALFRFASRHTPLTRLLRKALWRKRYWNTPAFNRWLDEFRPECVFLAFSNDFFILEIALYIAEKYDIPICSAIGDDYYFDDKFSINPLYYIYHEWYKHFCEKVFRHKGTAIYIGDKIRDKYNEAFGLGGETVYLVSDIERRAFRPIDPSNFSVRYFGNIGMGRNQSICRVAEALGRICPEVQIEVYSSTTRTELIQPFEEHRNVVFKGVVPYADVMRLSLDSDILLVVEGTKQRDINLSRYSLSTKVADALASGSNIVGFGSEECGAIEYLDKIGCTTTAHDIEEMERKLRRLIYDEILQRQNYDKARCVFETNHRLAQSNARVKRIVQSIIKKYPRHA